MLAKVALKLIETSTVSMSSIFTFIFTIIHQVAKPVIQIPQNRRKPLSKESSNWFGLAGIQLRF